MVVLTILRAHDPRQEDQHLRLIRADQESGHLGTFASPLVVFDKILWERRAVRDGIVHHLGGRLRIGVEFGNIFLHLRGGGGGEAAVSKFKSRALMMPADSCRPDI